MEAQLAVAIQICEFFRDHLVDGVLRTHVPISLSFVCLFLWSFVGLFVLFCCCFCFCFDFGFVVRWLVSFLIWYVASFAFWFSGEQLIRRVRISVSTLTLSGL